MHRLLTNTRSSIPLLALISLTFLAACGTESNAANTSQPNPETSTQTVKRINETTLQLAETSRPYVHVETLDAHPSTTALRAPARVEFKDGAIAHISSPLEGRITKVHVLQGQTVQANEPILTVHSPEASTIRAEIARLQIPRKSAQTELARQQRLTDREVGVQSELLAAEMHLAEIENDLKRAREMAAFLGAGNGPTITIRAPNAGTVLTLNARVGATIDPSTDAIATIGDPTALRIVADVFERDLPLIEVGATVHITLDTITKPITGTVEHIGTLVDRTLRRAPIFISLTENPENPQSTLRPGMFARADIQTATHTGLSVPATAVLIKDRGKYVVYTETQDLQFTAQPVQIGPTINGRVHILSGLKPGTRIVTRGALLLDSSAEQLL